MNLTVKTTIGLGHTAIASYFSSVITALSALSTSSSPLIPAVRTGLTTAPWASSKKLISSSFGDLMRLSFVMAGLMMAAAAVAAAAEQVVWDDRPATTWMTEAYPVGNGRLGAMVFGGVASERIQFNEATLWSGRPVTLAPAGDGTANLATLSGMIRAGNQWNEATAFANQHFTAPCNDFGCYLPFGDVTLELPGQAAEAGSYRRELHLGDGILRVAYRSGGVNYRRTVFASHPSGVIVVQLEADRPGALQGRLRLTSAQSAASAAQAGRLSFAGRLPGNGLAYAAGLAVQSRGGTLAAAGDALAFAGADALTIILAAATSYDPGVTGCIGNGDPAVAVAKALDHAQTAGFDRLLAEHLTDHRALAGRVTLSLAGPPAPSVPTRERLAAAAAGTPDPDLAALLFQFGRYLLIASSRPGGLPANLQGIWNQDQRPVWNCDWHTNINVQMNYWPAEVANLAECHRPLIDWIDRLRANGTRVARQWYGCDGWVTHWASNPWQRCEPGENVGWGLFLGATGWLSSHAWQAWEFSGDRADLERAWPILAGAAEFYLDLVEKSPGGRFHRDGTDREPANAWKPEGRRDFLMVVPSVSPETGFDYHVRGGRAFIDAGSAIDQQICRELLANTAAAAQVLGRDAKLRERIANVLPRLLPDAIAPDGRLQEWASPFDEPDVLHRHVSHLYALYPGGQIGVRRTPALAQAARASLLRRGDGGTGWARVWKMALWARLEDGERAHALFLSQLNPTTVVKESYGPKDGGTYPNLFCAHPPFQIDGNLGIVAAIAECLVQSQGGEIVLLPAVPRAWAVGGAVRGLRLRGGSELDLAWKDGRVLQAVIRSHRDTALRIRVPGSEPVALSVRAGRSYACGPELRFRETVKP